MTEPHWTPRGTIELIAGTPPGGGQDRVARAVCGALDELGQAAAVTNVPGRGGANAWDRLRRNPGNPEMVAVSSPTLVTNPLLGENPGYHSTLTALPTLCTEYMALVVAATSSIDSARSFLHSLATIRPRPVSLATAAGNINHMTLALVARHTGVDPRAVPIRVFDSAREAVSDVLTDGAPGAVVSAASAIPEIEDGSLRALAVSSPTRMAAPYAVVPTWVELGIPVTLGTWRGLVGPPNLTAHHIEYWDAYAERVTATNAWQEALATHRWEPTRSTAGETRLMLADCRRDYQVILTELGIVGT